MSMPAANTPSNSPVEEMNIAGYAPVPWTWGAFLRMIGTAIVHLFTVIGVLVAVFVIGHKALPRGLPYGLSRTVAVLIVASIVVYGPIAAAVYQSIKRRYGLSWRDLGFRQVSVRRLLLVALVIAPATYIGAGAALFVSLSLFHVHDFHNPQTAELTIGVGRSLPNVVGLFFCLAVIAPIVEELFFRGILYPLLRKSMPIGWAIVIGSALFAAAHAIPILFPWLFVVGIALTLTFDYCKSLYGSILLHAMINGFSTLVIVALLKPVT